MGTLPYNARGDDTLTNELDDEIARLRELCDRTGKLMRRLADRRRDGLMRRLLDRLLQIEMELAEKEVERAERDGVGVMEARERWVRCRALMSAMKIERQGLSS
jgi:hypothetical protein